MNKESEKVPFGVSFLIGHVSPVEQIQFCLAAISCFSMLDVKGRLARLRDLIRSVLLSFSSASKDETISSNSLTLCFNWEASSCVRKRETSSFSSIASFILHLLLLFFTLKDVVCLQIRGLMLFRIGRGEVGGGGGRKRGGSLCMLLPLQWSMDAARAATLEV